jgi:hypothetical protein
MTRVQLMLVAAAALAVGSATEAAPAGVQVGVLTCDISPGVGLLVGSSRDLTCTFKTGDHAEYYHGKVTNVGVDIGSHDGGQLTWAVVAPSKVTPGALAGNYAGVSGGVSAGVGAAANVLVGGSDHGVSLQPLSVAGDHGVNVSGGITGIELTFDD